jgi:hypothetical protein
MELASDEIVSVMLGRELAVPKNVARCLVCGKGLVVEPFEHEAATGLVTETGYFLWCEHDQALGYPQCDANRDGDYPGWLAIREGVFRWLTARVRIAQAVTP